MPKPTNMRYNYTFVKYVRVGQKSRVGLYKSDSSSENTCSDAQPSQIDLPAGRDGLRLPFTLLFSLRTFGMAWARLDMLFGALWVCTATFEIKVAVQFPRSGLLFGELWEASFLESVGLLGDLGGLFLGSRAHPAPRPT